MFSSLLPPRPELQLYGKLPMAKDYLRIGCAEGSALAWREWLDRVFSTDAAGGGARRLPWPMHFVIGAEGGHVLTGSLWNSTDAGGERSFPLTLFVQRKRSAAKRSLKGGFTEEVELWQAIERARERIDRHEDGKELLRAERGQLIRPTGSGGGGANVALEEWLEALWPEHRLDGVGATVEELTAAGGGRTPLPRRLPLASGKSVTEQVRAWLYLLDRADCCARSGVPSLFLPHLWSEDGGSEGGGRSPWMSVFFRELQPADVELLTADDGGGPHLPEPLGAERGAEHSSSEMSSKPLVETLRSALEGGPR